MGLNIIFLILRQDILRTPPICEQFVDYIDRELTLRLKTGAISYLGRVGEVEPPYFISPITIEQTKPRLCLNLMYLNCFIKDTPFSLDTLQDVPHLIKRNSYMSKMDDKSAYLNMLMTEKFKAVIRFSVGRTLFLLQSDLMGFSHISFVPFVLLFFYKATGTSEPVSVYSP